MDDKQLYKFLEDFTSFFVTTLGQFTPESFLTAPVSELQAARNQGEFYVTEMKKYESHMSPQHHSDYMALCVGWQTAAAALDYFIKVRSPQPRTATGPRSTVH